MFLPHPRVKISIVKSLSDREVAFSASDRQGSNLESCVWRTVLSQSSHHPQDVLLAQFSLYVHRGGLKPDSFPQHQCRILTSLSLGGSYPRLLGREKLWTTASFPNLGAGRTQLQPMRSWYFSRTSDVTLGDYGRAVGHSLWVKQDVPCAEVVLCCCQMSIE